MRCCCSPYAAARQLIDPVIPTVFSILPTYEEQTASLVEYLVKQRHAKRVSPSSI